MEPAKEVPGRGIVFLLDAACDLEALLRLREELFSEVGVLALEHLYLEDGHLAEAPRRGVGEVALEVAEDAHRLVVVAGEDGLLTLQGALDQLLLLVLQIPGDLRRGR